MHIIDNIFNLFILLCLYKLITTCLLFAQQKLEKLIKYINRTAKSPVKPPKLCSVSFVESDQDDSDISLSDQDERLIDIWGTDLDRPWHNAYITPLPLSPVVQFPRTRFGVFRSKLSPVIPKKKQPEFANLMEELAAANDSYGGFSDEE